MELSALTLTDLNAMTKTQLVAALTAGRTDTKTVVYTGDKRGQLREVRETKDLAGQLLSSQEVLWAYYPAGNVDTITIVERDGKGAETSRKVVKHAEGGGLASPS